MTPFLKILTEVITFGSTREGEAVLAATRSLPRLLDRRTKISVADVDQSPLIDAQAGIPFARALGKYSFLLPDLGEGGIRELRDPDMADDEIHD